MLSFLSLSINNYTIIGTAILSVLFVTGVIGVIVKYFKSK